MTFTYSDFFVSLKKQLACCNTWSGWRVLSLSPHHRGRTGCWRPESQCYQSFHFLDLTETVAPGQNLENKEKTSNHESSYHQIWSVIWLESSQLVTFNFNTQFFTLSNNGDSGCSIAAPSMWPNIANPLSIWNTGKKKNLNRWKYKLLHDAFCFELFHICCPSNAFTYGSNTKLWAEARLASFGNPSWRLPKSPSCFCLEFTWWWPS